MEIVGRTFGRLLVTADLGTVRKHRYVMARCECGVEKRFRADGIKSGHARSCGCLHQETIRTVGIRHGASHTKAHEVWANMMARCYYPKAPRYSRYGALGITVCDRWKTFENFLADMGQPPPGMTLDRIENGSHYAPDNCRWATRTQQQRNRSVTIRLTIGGETKSLSDWCDQFGLSHAMVATRLKRGWPESKIFDPPKFVRHLSR